MIINDPDKNSEQNSSGKFTVQIGNPMLCDRLYILSAEYSVSVELLVNIAVKRLLEDVEFVRSLRMGKFKNE